MTIGTVLQHDNTLQQDDTRQLQTDMHWEQHTTISHSAVFDIVHFTNIRTYLLTKQKAELRIVLKY